MAFQTERSRYDAALSQAFTALWRAHNAADSANLMGESIDCAGLLAEVRRLQEDSASMRHRAAGGQISIDYECGHRLTQAEGAYRNSAARNGTL